MRFNKISIIVTLLFSSTIFAQLNGNSISNHTSLNRKQVLDSIKNSFVHDPIASCIDNMWMKEMVSLDLYNELSLDIKNINLDEKVDYELSTELLKERLKKLDEKSPFNIEYNQGLENIIKSFLKNRKKSFERLMGVSQYYFPFFEEALSSQNIPLEIKYLAVVESALNPKAVSKMGATGLWQFMYQTGKQYNLNINTYVDERSDVLKSSKAASQYMHNMYSIFGDWDLVLASYNSGPGNVSKAIRRSGGQQNYWNIRKHLPLETQGYVPAFLATMYIFEYHKEHGIKPNKAIANHFKTDTVLVKKAMSFKQISELLDISVAELQFLNPSFKRDFVPHITGENHYLRLPIDKIAVFTSNEEKIYAFIKYDDSKRERPYESMLASRDSSRIGTDKIVSTVKMHKVTKGDNIKEISIKYGVTISDIKKWNKLKSNNVPLGKSLKIITTESIAVNKKSNKVDTLRIQENKQSIAALDSKNYKEEKVVTNKEIVKIHKIKKGDNLGAISDKYGVSIAELKKWNNLKNSNVAIGQNLKIISNEKVVTVVKKEIKSDKLPIETKTETALVVQDSNTNLNDKQSGSHLVQKGDNLFSISKKYNVTIEELKKWNNLEDENLKQGVALTIQKNNEVLTEKSEIKTIEYVVNKGDNLLNIAKKHNISVAELKEWNNLEDNNIQLGAKLIVSKTEEVHNDLAPKGTKSEGVVSVTKKESITYQVKKGDTLFTIAKKYPGISITDIKKWNKINDKSLKPGMKLKIIG